MSGSMPEPTPSQKFEVRSVVYYSGPAQRYTPYACAYMVLAWNSVDNTYTLISGRSLHLPVVLSGASPDDMVLVPKTKALYLDSEFPYIDRNATGGWPENEARTNIIKKNLEAHPP